MPVEVDDRDVDGSQDGGLPSVDTMVRFLALCDRVRFECSGRRLSGDRRDGVCGLPERDPWPERNTSEIRATVEYLTKHCRGTQAKGIVDGRRR